MNWCPSISCIVRNQFHCEDTGDLRTALECLPYFSLLGEDIALGFDVNGSRFTRILDCSSRKNLSFEPWVTCCPSQQCLGRLANGKTLWQSKSISGYCVVATNFHLHIQKQCVTQYHLQGGNGGRGDAFIYGLILSHFDVTSRNGTKDQTLQMPGKFVAKNKFWIYLWIYPQFRANIAVAGSSWKHFCGIPGSHPKCYAVVLKLFWEIYSLSKSL